jgi:DNA polymerase V
MKGIVDCNNFYCSCERLFKPWLDDKPVVVLSNNDGCIVSRSDEAKAFGVQMAGPYFMAKPMIEKHNVAVFSSNYNLYGDLSWRVMETLRTMLGKDKVEVYSVDECFLDFSEFDKDKLQQIALDIRETVEQWTGIKVSVGVAPTKTLAKLANKLSKKNKVETQCVMVLDTPEKIEAALERTPVGDIWGIGRQYAEKLKEDWGIYDALQLQRMTEKFASKYLGGVVGARLIRELKGIPSEELEEEFVNKKMIATTRMFGTPVKTIEEIKEAVATYVSRAAEKLRRQNSAAAVINVFVVPKATTKPGERFRHGPSIGSYTVLDVPTSSTHELIKPALKLVDRFFEKGKTYKKAGVILSGLVPDTTIQGNLFVPEKHNGKRMLMDMIDNINFSNRDDIIKFAASGTKRNWKMRAELRSPRYTTRWSELFLLR